MLEQISVCLAALFLRGLPRPINLTRRRWVKVVACLRSADCLAKDIPEVLRAGGFWEEAISLESPGLWEESAILVESAQVLTAVDDGYPVRWIGRLGDCAPPALWIRGSIVSMPLLGVVGSRKIDTEVQSFAHEIGQEAFRLGHGIVSGGAAGCDNAGAAGAISAGGFALEILPHGIDLYKRMDRCGVSVCAPDEIFSTAAAMERNALIYAAAEQTVIVQARFKAGGTWIGAVEATRKHVCPIIVRDDGSPAARALIGLGATPLIAPNELVAALALKPAQKGLFEIG